jgi:hypothetical protein
MDSLNINKKKIVQFMFTEFQTNVCVHACLCVRVRPINNSNNVTSVLSICIKKCITKSEI